MKLKKLIATICIVAMVMSVASLPVMADTPLPSPYTVNEEFSSAAPSNWVKINQNASTNSSATITTEQIGENNYALKLSGTRTDIAFKYLINDGNGIDLLADKNVVIETKFKQDLGNKARADFKINFGDTISGDKHIANANERFNYYRTAVALHEGLGVHAGDLNRDGSNVAVTNNTIGEMVDGKWTSNADWFTVKITYKGTTGRADVTVTDSDGDQITYTDKFVPFNNWASTNSASVTTKLDDVGFRAYLTDSDGPIATGTVYVDYLKIYQTSNLSNVTMLTPVIAQDGAVQIKFDAGTDGIRDVSEAVEIYEGATLIPSTKTMDTATGIVTLKPNADLAQAVSYKVVVDTTKMRNLAEYNYTYGQTEFPFTTYTCTAANVSVTGDIYSGGILGANFDFVSDTKQPGASTYKWQKASSANGPWTDILGETSGTLAVRDEYIENETFIRFAVTPVASDGTYGAEAFSTPVVPPKRPVASYLRYNASSPYTGLTLIANYDYFDYNGDIEKDTVVKWYIGDTADSCNTEVRTSKHIRLDDSYEGKYVKFTVTPKADSELNPEGLTVHSTPAGPVVGILEATNLFANPGLETGQLDPWFIYDTRTENYKGIEVTTEAAYSGDYSMRVYPRFGNLQDKWVQSVDMEGGKRYIVSAMVRNVSAASAPSSSLRVYSWTGTGGTDWNLPYEAADMATVNSTEWKRIYTTFDAKRSGFYTYDITYLDFFNFHHELYMDDFYCGPLLIGDIGTTEHDPITIPTSGSIRLPITNGIIYDQFGNTDRIADQTVNLSTDAPGIIIDGEFIYVTSQAVAGRADIKVSCDYTVAGVKQMEYIEYVELDLVANNDTAPKALDVTATGVVANGNTLTGSYTYHQVEGKPNASVTKWMYSDTEDGAYLDIPGATGLTYTVAPAYANKFIKFAVVPKTTDGLVGTQTLSNVLAVPTAPYAENVRVTGDFKVGGTINGSYTYHDINGDTESGSTYKWYISDTEDGVYTAIDGQTAQTLRLTEEMTDKFIKFAVTPKSDTAPTDGVETESFVVMGPTAPVVKNLQIKVDGTRLTAVYDYVHPHNARELSPVYSWKVDGREVSNKQDYVINFNGIKSVTLTVTPVGDTIPAKGTPVSVSSQFMGFANNESSSGSGFGGTGGGGGGGGAFTGGVTNIGDMDYGQNDEREKGDNEKPPYNPNEVQDTPEIDITEYLDTELTGTSLDYHWGFPYIKPLITRGVMGAEEDGEYHPDKDVDREEMLTYLFKALNLTPTEYKGTFGDVEDGEFAQMLQTMVDNGTIAVDDNFRPNDTITREEMCKILYVSLKNAGVLKNFDTMVIEKFDDFNKVSDWAKEYVNAIYATKVMVGVSDTEFDPKGTVTKAQAAVMFLRILALTEKEAE